MRPISDSYVPETYADLLRCVKQTQGFEFYRWLPEDGFRAKAGDIVRIAADGTIRPAPDATKADLFTYAATIRRVVDGDTLIIAIDVAPQVYHVEKMRLRGLDCPEISCDEGGAANRFTESLLVRGQPVIIHTTKPDKYDRCLADVFVPPSVGSDSQLATPDAQLAASGPVFLNNALLEHGHAERKDAWEFGDWGLE